MKTKNRRKINWKKKDIWNKKKKRKPNRKEILITLEQKQTREKWNNRLRKKREWVCVCRWVVKVREEEESNERRMRGAAWKDLQIVFVLLPVIPGLQTRGSQRVNAAPSTPRGFIPQNPSAWSPAAVVEHNHPRLRVSWSLSFTLHHLKCYPPAAHLPYLSCH